MIIVVENKEALLKLIQNTIVKEGNHCDLNFIDTSKITDMSHLFSHFSHFNGNISKWNTSNVKCMCCMFKNSQFNGDISQWDTSNVENMYAMFNNSCFSGDISKWNTSNLKIYNNLFFKAKNFNVPSWAKI